MNITRCSIISRRRAERDNGERCFFRGLCLRKKDAISQKKRKKHHMPDMCLAYDAYEAYEVLFRDDCIACGLCGDVLRRPRGLGGDFEFLPLKSPRNPITPIETSRVATLHPELYKELREDAEYRRERDARPYNVAENCNSEMCLQRWVASLQRLEAFATVGCIAVLRRGAHCAPVYLRCYNNLSRGRAKGYRGDRKAPISNRRQGRRP